MSPYNLQHYLSEFDETHVEDYAVLCHSGHGVNSYALQYYLVYGALGMFLHLGWGGVYMDAKRAATEIADCFSLAGEIVLAVQAAQRFQPAARLRLVGPDFYGSSWLAPVTSRRKEDAK